MSTQIPPRQGERVSIPMSQKISDFAFSKVPLGKEGWCGTSARSNFYAVCRSYHARFKAPVPPELFEELWAHSLKLPRS